MSGTNTNNVDVKIYNDESQTAYLERLQDQLAVFNGASAGCLLLTAESIPGDLRKTAFYKGDASLRWRDPNSNEPVTSSGLSMDEQVGIKVPWMLDPKSATEESFKRRARSLTEFAQLMGAETADATVSYQIDHALKALQAASTSSGMTVKGTVGADGTKLFTKAMRRFGDKAERVKLFVMHSATYHDLVDKAISEVTYQSESVVLYNGSPASLGRPILVTDRCPIDKIFALQPGAAVITESQAPAFRFYEDNAHENLGVMYRAEGTFNIDLLGYTYELSQGINPKLDVISSPAAWRKITKSDKLLAGVVIDLAA